MHDGEIIDFVYIFSTGCLLVGMIAFGLMWAGVKAHICHPRNARVILINGYGLALAGAGLYSLLLFCPVMDWLGSWSPGLAFGWFLVTNPIWLFCGLLYANREVRVALNNLR